MRPGIYHDTTEELLGLLTFWHRRATDRSFRPLRLFCCFFVFPGPFFGPSGPRSGRESLRLLRKRHYDLAVTSPKSLRGGEAPEAIWWLRMLRKRNDDLAVILFAGHCEGRRPEAIPALEEEIASQTKLRARSDSFCLSLRGAKPRSNLKGLLRRRKDDLAVTPYFVTARSEATKRSRISTRWGEGRLLRWAKKRSSQ